MICLGIESTAHTFGVGMMNEKGTILADARDTFKPPAGWGIKPIDAKEHHERVKEKLLNSALAEAGLKLDDVDVFAFSHGAGLPPCLKVGRNFALELAGGKPLVPVCHQIGHLEIAKLLVHAKDPIFVYVSGANTQIISLSAGRYRVFGETQDVGLGNALDKFGREAGMQFPCGPKIEEMAKKGSYLELPYVVKGMDLSFSGILTSALQKYKKEEKLEDVCFSLQETFFAMLTEVAERALAHTGKHEVLLTGGVAANKRLCGMLETMAKERGGIFLACPLKYSGDNGVMIAWNGLQIFQAGKISADTEIYPRLRTDDVDVLWVRS